MRVPPDQSGAACPARSSATSGDGRASTRVSRVSRVANVNTSVRGPPARRSRPAAAGRARTAPSSPRCRRARPAGAAAGAAGAGPAGPGTRRCAGPGAAWPRRSTAPARARLVAAGPARRGGQPQPPHRRDEPGQLVRRERRRSPGWPAVRRRRRAPGYGDSWSGSSVALRTARSRRVWRRPSSLPRPAPAAGGPRPAAAGSDRPETAASLRVAAVTRPGRPGRRRRASKTRSKTAISAGSPTSVARPHQYSSRTVCGPGQRDRRGEPGRPLRAHRQSLGPQPRAEAGREHRPGQPAGQPSPSSAARPVSRAASQVLVVLEHRAERVLGRAGVQVVRPEHGQRGGPADRLGHPGRLVEVQGPQPVDRPGDGRGERLGGAGHAATDDLGDPVRPGVAGSSGRGSGA